MNNDLKKVENAVDISNEVDMYIMDTLKFNPSCFIKNEKYVEIKVYALGESKPEMKILRAISRLEDIESTPEGCKEISFQDEISILKDGKIEVGKMFQVNFSVFVKKESCVFVSINEKPKSILSVKESLSVFERLSKEKGATLYAGDWTFKSDGNKWVPKDMNFFQALCLCFS